MFLRLIVGCSGALLFIVGIVLLWRQTCGLGVICLCLAAVVADQVSEP